MLQVTCEVSSRCLPKCFNVQPGRGVQLTSGDKLMSNHCYLFPLIVRVFPEAQTNWLPGLVTCLRHATCAFENKQLLKATNSMLSSNGRLNSYQALSNPLGWLFSPDRFGLIFVEAMQNASGFFYTDTKQIFGGIIQRLTAAVHDCNLFA